MAKDEVLAKALKEYRGNLREGGTEYNSRVLAIITLRAIAGSDGNLISSRQAAEMLDRALSKKSARPRSRGFAVAA